MAVWISFEYLAIASIAIALIAVSYSIYTAHSSRKHLLSLTDHVNQLGKELNALNHSTLGMGRRLQALVEKNEVLTKELEEIQKNDPVKVSYSEAARLVTMGASVKELMSACGISRPEAELVSALTKQKSHESSDAIPVLDTKA